MLATSPHLHVRRPSPTTAEFTVTTAPPSTIALRLMLAAVALARLLVASGVLLLLYAKYAQSPYAAAAAAAPQSPNPDNPPPDFLSLTTLQRALDALLASPRARWVDDFASASPVWALLPPALGVLYLCVLRMHTTERLLVLRGLGIQTSSSAGTYLWGTATRFIPTEKICDVLINEAFRGFEVRYYLVVVVDGEEDLVVVFPRLLPGRKIVEAVWRGVRGCLYEGDMRKESNGHGP